MGYFKNLHTKNITCCAQCVAHEEEDLAGEKADTMTMFEWAAFHGFKELCHEKI